MYLDTCIEPWPGGYTDATIPHARRTNYALREEALALRAQTPRAPTAVLTHGANPGLVSHFVKQALLNIANDTGVDAGSAEVARGLGPARAQARHQGDPHRRARHAARGEAEGVQRIRQHLVGGRLRERGPAARRARLGHAREELPARRQALRLRRRLGYLPHAARRGHARAHLDAEGRPLPRLPDHARRGDLDRRLSVRAPELGGGVPPDGALLLPPERFGGGVGARVRRPQLAPAGSPAHPHGRDHLGHGRARRAARRAQEECLLVRLAAHHRRGAQARAVQQRHQPAGHGRRACRA